jgi:hypothetical protein
MAFLEQIAVRIGLDPKDLRKGARAVMRDLKDIKSAAADAGDGISTLTDGFKTFGQNLALVTGAVTAVAAGFFGLTKAASDAADAVGRSAAAMGLTVEEYGRLTFAANQSGLATEEFGQAFVRFNKLVIAAQRGEKSAIETFRRATVQVRDGAGVLREYNIRLFDNRGRALRSARVLSQLARNFSLVRNGSEKSAQAVAFFGRAGADLITFLNEGDRGLKALGDQAVELGGVFTEQQVKIGDEFGDAADRSTFALRGLRNQIGLTFAADQTALLDSFTAELVKHREEILRIANQAYGFVRQTALDFFNAFAGNEAQVAQQWVITFRDSIVAIGTAISNVYTNVVVPVFILIRDLLTNIANGINEAFGTNISAADIAVGLFVARFLGFFTLIQGALQVVIPLLRVFWSLLGLSVIRPVIALLSSRVIVGFFTLLAKGVVIATVAIAGFIGWPATLVLGLIAAGAALAIFWSDIKSAAQATYDFIANLFSSLAAAVRKGLSVAGDFVAGFTGAKESGTVDLQRRATGGQIFGPGGRDRVPLLGTAGEFVMQLSAVRKYGLAFMEAINAGALPQFAEGGAVGGAALRPINLSIDGSTFAMQGGDTTAENLVRWARRKQIRTPGRLPSWGSAR